MYKKGRVNSNSRIISTDEDPSLRIESSAIINLRGVSTKLNKYNIPIIRIALLTNRCTMLSNNNTIYSKLNIGVSSAWSLHGMHPGRLGSLYINNGTILLAEALTIEDIST